MIFSGDPDQYCQETLNIFVIFFFFFGGGGWVGIPRPPSDPPSIVLNLVLTLEVLISCICIGQDLLKIEREVVDTFLSLN